MSAIKQAVILAGGVGVRLRPLTYTVPKPMVRVNERPFLEHLIGLLKKNGITEVVLLLGYMADTIVDHFGDGSKFGVKITYSVGEVFFETGKRIKYAEDLLDDQFLMMYCDNYWPLRLDKLAAFHTEKGKQATVTVYNNKDQITRSNVLVSDGIVQKYDRTREEHNLNGVEIGFFILNKKIVQEMPTENSSFEKETLPKLIAAGELAGYQTDHKYYSVGTMERLEITESFLQPKKVVFLDRDGVINKGAAKADYIKTWDAFEFLPGAVNAIKMLTENDYKIFIITNQAGIARGFMTEQDLMTIHNNMRSELKKNGTEITAIYYCPHGWDENCECRKPKTGMLYQAAREFDLDLTKSVLIGDDDRDIEAGNAAGCRSIKVTAEKDLRAIVEELVAEEEKV